MTLILIKQIILIAKRPDYELRIAGEGMPICPHFAPPAPLEPPSRKCYLQVLSWVKDSRADLPGKIGPCSTCGQTTDCCDAPGTCDLSGSRSRSLFPSIHPCSNRSIRKVSTAGVVSESEVEGRRESRIFSVYGEGRIGRHASFDKAKVEDARHETLLNFPELFNAWESEHGDLVIRFNIDFPKNVPGNRRELVQKSLDGLVEVPDRRVSFNKKY
jgi:hypothetical protein